MSEEQPKDQVLQVLVTQEERELVEEISKKDNRSVSQFCRIAILEKIDTKVYKK